MIVSANKLQHPYCLSSVKWVLKHEHFLIIQQKLRTINIVLFRKVKLPFNNTLKQYEINYKFRIFFTFCIFAAWRTHIVDYASSLHEWIITSALSCVNQLTTLSCHLSFNGHKLTAKFRRLHSYKKYYRISIVWSSHFCKVFVKLAVMQKHLIYFRYYIHQWINLWTRIDLSNI